MAVVFDLIGHSDWRCSVLLWHRPVMMDFRTLGESELQQLCKEKRLPASGSKQELADRLSAADPSELLFGHLRYCPIELKCETMLKHAPFLSADSTTRFPLTVGTCRAVNIPANLPIPKHYLAPTPFPFNQHVQEKKA
jgi:hypothetical protein